jgi:eukaryotic-like serine/threonine-protein kinase
MTMRTQPPRLLDDRYELETLLSEGGMGAVYLGTDHRLWGRQVAVKLLSPRYMGDERAVARFRREARAAASLSHPNVVAVFDAGTDGDHHYIVTEYIEGQTLADVVRSQGPLDPDRALAITADVCRALGAAHDQGLVHRDVKPGNIMLTRSGDVKVTDFGIARVMDEVPVTETATVLGTAAYISPEQVRGGEVDGRSDLYALGCTLYEALTGTPPFSGENLMSVAYRHVTESPRSPRELRPDLDPSIEAVVMRALAKNPHERFPDASEMLKGIAEAVATLSEPPDTEQTTLAATTLQHRAGPTEVLEPFAETPGPEGARRAQSRWPLVAALSIVGGLALLVALFGMRLDQPPADQPEGDPAPGAQAQDGDADSGPGGEELPEPEPEPEPRIEAPTPTGVHGAALGFTNTAHEGIAAGEVSADAADELFKKLGEAFKEYLNGKPDKAADKMDDLREAIDDYEEDGDISPNYADLLRAEAAALAEAFEAER